MRRGACGVRCGACGVLHTACAAPHQVALTCLRWDILLLSLALHILLRLVCRSLRRRRLHLPHGPIQEGGWSRLGFGADAMHQRRVTRRLPSRTPGCVAPTGMQRPPARLLATYLHLRPADAAHHVRLGLGVQLPTEHWVAHQPPLRRRTRGRRRRGFAIVLLAALPALGSLLLPALAPPGIFRLRRCHRRDHLEPPLHLGHRRRGELCTVNPKRLQPDPEHGLHPHPDRQPHHGRRILICCRVRRNPALRRLRIPCELIARTELDVDALVGDTEGGGDHVGHNPQSQHFLRRLDLRRVLLLAHLPRPTLPAALDALFRRRLRLGGCLGGGSLGRSGGPQLFCLSPLRRPRIETKLQHQVGRLLLPPQVEAPHIIELAMPPVRASEDEQRRIGGPAARVPRTFGWRIVLRLQLAPRAVCQRVRMQRCSWLCTTRSRWAARRRRWGPISGRGRCCGEATEAHDVAVDALERVAARREEHRPAWAVVREFGGST